MHVRQVKNALDEADSVDREYEVELTDDSGEMCAVVEKTGHVSTDEGKRA